MRIKMFFLVLVMAAAAVTAWAQDLKNNFYVKVLSRELQRNVARLHLPDLEKPFFIAYDLRNQYTYSINAERGSITSSVRTPVNNKSVSIKLLVGDYHRNFDYMMFDGYYVNLPDEDNAEEYRRLIWLETDRAYKNNSRQFSSFMSSLNRVNVDEKELQLDDLSKITPVVHDYGAVEPVRADTQKWEQRLRSLSALFNAYPDITTSYCRLSVNNYEDYLVTNEGTVIRKPGNEVTFFVYGATTDEEGNNFDERYTITVKRMEELPSYEELQQQIKQVIKSIRQKQQAVPFEGSYMGPVLFTDNAVSDIVYQCFVNMLPVNRKSILGFKSGETNYEEKLGQKLVASGLTLKAIPSLKVFNGQYTTGYYPVDDQGVRPPDSLVLIQNGILKALLNGRTPTKRFPVSQGFAQSFLGKNYSAGVLKLSSEKPISEDSMRNKLLQLARGEGLKDAYIVTAVNYNRPTVFKIEVASGKIQMVNECMLTPLNVRSLRRFEVASAKMHLENASRFSIIAPQSIIISEVEIEKADNTTKPKPIVVSNPLLDKKNSTINKPSGMHKKTTLPGKPQV
ncbi:MAG: metallopeptidase TldD-related protein [Niabella sp.]